MTLRIERSERGQCTVFVLSGRLGVDYVGELQQLLGPVRNYATLILDLNDVKLADIEGVRFLIQCEAHGLKLENCPRYIRRWMEQEAAKPPLIDPDDRRREKE